MDQLLALTLITVDVLEVDLAELCRERQSVAEELALVKVTLINCNVIVKLNQLYYEMNQV